MAFRSDISIDWTVSPRIITIASPSTELTMQDLLDTLRELEDDMINLSRPQIVSGSGKEELGGGTRVGITIKLLNAKIAFEGRPGPDWVLCTLLGGNLVAVNSNDVPIEVRYPTSYVTIDRTSASSATLQEQDALNYSSYGGVVSVDITSGNSGTTYPVGNMEFPVNNIPDAVTIGANKGFKSLRITGSITFSTGDDVRNYLIEGINPVRTSILIEPESLTDGCEIREATVAGTLDDDTILRNCIIKQLDYINGFIYNCGLGIELITLGSTSQAVFVNCFSTVPGFDTPTIDMNGSGQALALREYSGGLRLINRTGADSVSLDFNSGHLKLDSTCIAGTIYARGVMKITDNSGAGCTVDTSGRVTTGDITFDSSDLHTGLDGYANKDDWKASAIDMTETNDKIDAVAAAVAAIPLDELTSEQHNKLMSLINADFTGTNALIEAVPTATENADALIGRTV